MRIRLFIVLSLLFTVSACKEAVNFESSSDDPYVGGATTDEIEEVGPKVLIDEEPEDHKLGKSTKAIFKVVKGTSAIKEVECSINRFKIKCDWLKGILPLVALPLGDHELIITAVDENGLKARAQVDWKVFQGFDRVDESFEVNEQHSQTDILFVIDNSSSMWAEQKEMSQRFDKFIHKVKHLDWHVAVTTTDPRSNKAWSDGRIDPFDNGDYFLTSQLGVGLAQKLFASEVRRNESGWDTEEGIRATYRALERSMNPRSEVDRELSRFFREKSALAVVLVSDEDESDGDKENQGKELMKLVEKKWGKNKVFQFNSIITHTDECLWGAGKAKGYSYQLLSKWTAGIVGDICADNYSEMLSDIGEGVANLVKVHKLNCEPQDIDQDGKVDLRIKGPGSLPGFTIDKDKLEFDEPLKAGSYRLKYFCLDV